MEDNKYMREGWTTVIEQSPGMQITGSYENCEGALAGQRVSSADVMILDIEMDGMSGTEGIAHFLEENEQLAIIMASVYEDSTHIFEALKNGAIGYLEKNINPEALIKAIEDAHKGGSPMSPGIARKVITEFHSSTDQQSDPKKQLSERETEILSLMASGKSYQAIAQKIYLSKDGVSYHIRNIYKKLNVKTRSEAISKGFRKNII